MSAKRPAILLPTRADVVGSAGPGPRLRDAFYIPLARLDPNPDQPRKLADADRLAELAADIKEHGVLEPLIVRPVGDRYQVIAGGRRLAAATLAGLTEVPCLVRDDLTDEDARAIALVENLQREDLDPEDEGRAFKVLVDQGWSQRKIAGAIHKSHQYVMRRLQLIDNPAALAAWRAGAVDLTQLLDVEQAPPVATLADAAQAAADQLLQADNNGPDRTTLLPGSDNGPVRTTPVVFDEARVQRAATIYKPTNKMVRVYQQLQPEAIPLEERPELLRVLGDLQDEVARLVRGLREGA